MRPRSGRQGRGVKCTRDYGDRGYRSVVVVAVVAAMRARASGRARRMAAGREEKMTGGQRSSHPLLSQAWLEEGDVFCGNENGRGRCQAPLKPRLFLGLPEGDLDGGRHIFSPLLTSFAAVRKGEKVSASPILKG